jgi:hyperosmotically inducible protein
MIMKKTFNKTLIAAAITGAVLSIPVAAAQDSVKDIQAQQDAKFNKLDANRDGTLSRQEVRTVAHYEKSFAQADEDKNGSLSRDEFLKAEAIYDREQAAGFVDDSVITTKVKASMVKEFKNLKVSVETYRGNVLLSGFVDNDAQIQKAVQVASSIKGVQSVKNGLAVK